MPNESSKPNRNSVPPPFNVGLLKKQLSKYGKVEECYTHHGMFHIKITTGFVNTLAASVDIGKLMSVVFEQYPVIHKMEVDENLYHLILKPAKAN